MILSMVDPVSIQEAANVLGVDPSRVRAMAAHGQLPAEKIGSRWLLEKADVERRRRQAAPPGRRLAPHNAWAMLLLASGDEVEGVDPSVRSRLRRALRLASLEQLAPRLERRAKVISFDAHPGELRHLLGAPDLIPSGISAAASHGLDLVSGEEIDGYLAEDKLDQVARRHALRPAAHGNARLRVVPRDSWRFLENNKIAPIAAVALDLFEDSDPRSSGAGRAALREFGSPSR